MDDVGWVPRVRKLGDHFRGVKAVQGIVEINGVDVTDLVTSDLPIEDVIAKIEQRIKLGD